MSVKSIMTTDVVCVHMDDSLGFAKSLFNSHSFHHLLVTDDSRLVGVLSDRDLLSAISPNVGTVAACTRDEMTLQKRVHLAMSHDPITLPVTATLLQAVDLFLENNISCLPIVDKDFKPKGIVTSRDVLKVISKYYHLREKESSDS